MAKLDSTKLREAMHKLFDDAGYVDEELKEFLEEAIKTMGRDGTKPNSHSKAKKQQLTDTMNSKLRDALRE